MHTRILAIVTILCTSVAICAQRPGTSAEAQRANRHYSQGWNAMRSEAWAEAVSEFQAALDIDPKFTLAYYSLGRAHMGLRDFPKAIAAYTKCRDVYVTGAGDEYAGQLNVGRRIDDRIREYQAALRDATQRTALNAAAQSQNLYARELQAEITRLEQARDRNLNVTIDTTVPFFVPMALGAAYFRNGQMVDAEREYKVALAANPASGETLNNLAIVYMLTGRLDEAEKTIAQAKKAGFKVNPQLEQDLKDKKRGR